MLYNVKDKAKDKDKVKDKAKHKANDKYTQHRHHLQAPDPSLMPFFKLEK